MRVHAMVVKMPVEDGTSCCSRANYKTRGVATLHKK
jgi:hypothetical protein